MRIKSERPIAIFDLDGVIVANPKESLQGHSITDGNYWFNHWTKPELAIFHDEVLTLIKALKPTHHIIVLTARPAKYRAYTIDLLHRAGIFVTDVDTLTDLTTRVALVMIGPDEITGHSAAWKRDTIQSWLDQGANISFMMEDYKPNAEFVRELIPVFLYERKKQSKHYNTDALGV